MFVERLWAQQCMRNVVSKIVSSLVSKDYRQQVHEVFAHAIPKGFIGEKTVQLPFLNSRPSSNGRRPPDFGREISKNAFDLDCKNVDGGNEIPTQKVGDPGSEQFESV